MGNFVYCSERTSYGGFGVSPKAGILTKLRIQIKTAASTRVGQGAGGSTGDRRRTVTCRSSRWKLLPAGCRGRPVRAAFFARLPPQLARAFPSFAASLFQRERGIWREHRHERGILAGARARDLVGDAVLNPYVGRSDCFPHRVALTVASLLLAEEKRDLLKEITLVCRKEVWSSWQLQIDVEGWRSGLAWSVGHALRRIR
jgi:hypothetical protein